MESDHIYLLCFFTRVFFVVWLVWYICIEWGVDKKFLDDNAVKLDKDVLQSVFVAMAIGGNRMDSGKNKAKSWLTPGSKEYLIRSKINNGALKVKKKEKIHVCVVVFTPIY